jgi:hypothetical protein
MLVLTGALLAGVLVVMIGESAQEMQQAHWIPTTPIHIPIPDWAGVWFAIFPTWETMANVANKCAKDSFYTSHGSTCRTPRF